MKISNRLDSIYSLILFFIISFQISSENQLFSQSKFNQANSNISLTEVMFDPIGSEYYDEFVEIYNLSSTDSVELSGW